MSTTEDVRRFSVVGTSCSGKTHFAAALAARLGLPHVPLDELYWKPNWEERPVAEFRSAVGEAVSGERWVVDGNYSKARDLVWGRATDVIWLNYSFPRVFGRAVRRTVNRIATQEELFGGNRETFRQSFLSPRSILHWVIATHGHNRRKYASLRDSDEWRHLRFTEFRYPREATEFLSNQR